MPGEDSVVIIENGRPTNRNIEDNLHSYTNSSGAVAVGDAVYQVSGADSQVAVADADNGATQPPIGVVTQVVDATNCVVCHSGGIATGLSGLTRGSPYWLTATGTTGNTLTTTKPGSNVFIIGVALSSSALLVTCLPASVDGGGGGGGLSGSIGSTDNVIVRADGTSGDTVQGTGISIDDSNNIVDAASLVMPEQTSIPASPGASAGSFYVRQASGSTYPAFADENDLDQGMLTFVELERSMPSSNGDSVELGSFSAINQGQTFSVIVHGGTATSVDYIGFHRVVALANNTSGFVTVRPLYALDRVTLSSFSDVVSLEMEISSGVVNLRLRSYIGVGTTIKARIVFDGDTDVTFTPSSTQATTTAPTANYESTSLTMASQIGGTSGSTGLVFWQPSYLEERAAANPDVPGFGQLWVRDDSPNVLVFTDDGGNDFDLSVTSVSGSTGSVDNALIRADGTGGSTIQGGSTNNSVILDNNGNIGPEVSDGGALGNITRLWSDIFLANGAVINYNVNDVTITHTTNTLTFSGANNGYQFATGPVRPSSNDGVALGTSSAAWSDLFLALGGVIDFNNGNVTITHASNDLSFAGATNGYTFDNTLIINERSSALGSVATEGQLWVKDSSPNVLVFTDDTGSTFSLNNFVDNRTANHTLTDLDDGKTWTNNGAGALVELTLPASTFNGYTATFVVMDADGIRVNAPTGQTIRIGPSTVSTAAGYIESTTIGSTIVIRKVATNDWYLIGDFSGTWTAA